MTPTQSLKSQVAMLREALEIQMVLVQSEYCSHRGECGDHELCYASEGYKALQSTADQWTNAIKARELEIILEDGVIAFEKENMDQENLLWCIKKFLRMRIDVFRNRAKALRSKPGEPK